MTKHELQNQLLTLGARPHALAVQMLGNTDDAADAVQDALATVLSKPAAYDASRGAFKPWFMRVVRNRCLDLLRQRRRDPREPNDKNAEGEKPRSAVDLLAVEAKSAEDEIHERQRDLTLERALQTLTAEHREIIILRDYLSLSYQEVADVTGIAPGTVMSRLHRARNALRNALAAAKPVASPYAKPMGTAPATGIPTPTTKESS